MALTFDGCCTRSRFRWDARREQAVIHAASFRNFAAAQGRKRYQKYDMSHNHKFLDRHRKKANIRYRH